MSVSMTLRWLVILTMLALVLAASFLLFEGRIETLVIDLLSGTQSSSGLWALIVTALALDVVLPVPSSVVNVSAGTLLGVAVGTFACWTGMTLSCLLGYWIGATGGTRALDVERLSAPFVTLFVNSTGEAAASRSLPRRLHFGIGARKNWSAARSPGLSGQEVMLRAS